MDPFTLALLAGFLATTGGSIAVTLIITSPRLMRLVRRRIRGSNVVILGNRGAGKTSFWNYIRNDQFADTRGTLSTVLPRPLGAISIDKGDDLRLDLKPTEDLPGEWRVDAIGEAIRRQRPELLLVLVALDDAAAVAWFREFCASLNLLLLVV